MRALRDDRDRMVVDVGAMVQWFGLPCSCHCRHCLLDSRRSTTSVLFSEAEAVAKKLALRRKVEGKPAFYVDLYTGYPCCSPYVERCLEFNAKHGGTHPHVPMNGRRFVKEAELRRFLQSIRDAGAASVSLTFYGLRDLHDAWAGRGGDFDSLLQIARLAADCGLPRQETIFLSSQSIPGIAELLQVLDDIPGVESRALAVWDYRGRGKKLLRERPTLADLDLLPDGIRQQVGSGRRYDAYKPESEWVKSIVAGDFPRLNRRYYLLTVREDTVETLLSTRPSATIDRIRKTNDRFLKSLPSLPRLAELYGRRDGPHLYSSRDLEWKWTDEHLAAHPEIDATGRFSDSSTSVLWS